MSNDAILDSGPKAEAAKHLIDRIFDGVGSVVNRYLLDESLAKKALRIYVEDIEKSEIPPEEKAIKILNAKETLRKLKEEHNKTQIVKKTRSFLTEKAHPEAIDQDWLAQFEDRARLVSDEDFQILWAGILAEECNSPGSMPKSLLRILEQMDKSMADAFMKVASCSVWYIENGRKRYAPLIYHSLSTGAYCKEVGLHLEELIDLESVGLLRIHTGSQKSVYYRKYSGIIHYFDKETIVKPSPEGIEIGNVEFTKAGEALCAAVKPTEISNFLTERVQMYMSGVRSMRGAWIPGE